MLLMIEDPCLHSHVEEKISSCGAARWAGVGCEETMRTQKLVGLHYLSFTFVVSSEYISMSASCSPILTARSDGSTEKGLVMLAQCQVQEEVLQFNLEH